MLAKQHNQENDNQYLIGYYVADNLLNENLILEYLTKHLPSYMVPTILVWLEQLPLTVNGKLDRSALPDPVLTNQSNYTAPRNELERKVCALYAEVLNLPFEQIGIQDDFFRLGGNSILAIKLINKLNNEIFKKIKLNLIDIYIYKNIVNLIEAKLINSSTMIYEEGEI